MHPTAVIDVVGLTPELLGPHTPNLNALARSGAVAPIRAVVPAVTCTAHATFLTGRLPREHGIVANGWYFRDLAQIMFWRQANQLVQGEKVWDTARARDASFTCAQMFWWYNMYANVEWSVTPRPIYPADGRKIPDIYSHPADIRDRLSSELGAFPLFDFWGPKAGIRSSEWIAEASMRVDTWHAPTLLLVYLPHLDYDLQRFGPGDPRIHASLADIDRVCGRLITHCQARGRRIVVVSDYGIVPVRRQVHINRALRDAGFIHVRDELGTDALDVGASVAFAVADHQIAHVYVRDESMIPAVKRLVAQMPGVEAVLDRREQAAEGLDHPRSGELVAIAEPDAWFTYYYWSDDRRAPDFARTVDIHRKPGYDPAELFLDPALSFPAVRIAATLARKALGFRYLLEVIALDGAQVRGSHGRRTDRLEQGPVVISSEKGAVEGAVDATDIRDLILSHVFETRPSLRQPM